ncbi:MAG: hypothetical protein ACTSVO_03155 [Candidatus Heimdallarchaeaceae archaeon]
MAVYISTHFNLSSSLVPVTRDEYDKYTKIINWFLINKSARGTISTNSLFLLSNMWGNKTILKNLSKLCLANQIELSSSMYSNFIPMNQPYEERLIKSQINQASMILNNIFPAKYIKGYYPPFGVWDKKSVGTLADLGYKYVIMDWHIIAKALNSKPTGAFEVKYFKPFKLKNQNIFVLPSFNLRSVFRNYPETYEETMHSGEVMNLMELIKEGIEISKETNQDYCGILSLDLNDMRFPVFPPQFDFENYLNESNKILNQPAIFLKPSEMIEKFEEIQEIDIESGYPHEVTLTMGYQGGLKLTPYCVKYSQLFHKHLNNLEDIEKRSNATSNETKQKIVNLLKYAHNYLITKQHNFCFDIFSEPVKGVNTLSNAENWESISHLNLIEKIAEMFLKKETDQIDLSTCIGQKCTESIFIGNDLLCSLTNKGGVITNLIDLKKGVVLTSCPSKDLALDKTTQEPRYGLMYDVISKRHSGQYNLFNDRYTYNSVEKGDSTTITFSNYAVENILLSKVFKFENNSPRFDVQYNLKNFGCRSDEFSILSISKINLGEYHTQFLSQDEIEVVEEKQSSNINSVKIFNKELASGLEIKIPVNINVKIEKNFGNFELSLRIKVPQLRRMEEKSFSFKIEVLQKL